MVGQHWNTRVLISCSWTPGPLPGAVAHGHGIFLSHPVLLLLELDGRSTGQASISDGQPVAAARRLPWVQCVRGCTICRGVNSDNKTPHSVQQFQTRAVMRDTPPPPLNSAAPSLQEAAPREKCTRQPSPNASANSTPPCSRRSLQQQPTGKKGFVCKSPPRGASLTRASRLPALSMAAPSSRLQLRLPPPG